MSVKTRRGLGLLVLAAIGWLVGIAGTRINSGDGAAYWFGTVLVLAGAAAFIVGIIGGLILLAWGLLRD